MLSWLCCLVCPWPCLGSFNGTKGRIAMWEGFCYAGILLLDLSFKVECRMAPPVYFEIVWKSAPAGGAGPRDRMGTLRLSFSGSRVANRFWWKSRFGINVWIFQGRPAFIFGHGGAPCMRWSLSTDCRFQTFPLLCERTRYVELLRHRRNQSRRSFGSPKNWV